MFIYLFAYKAIQDFKTYCLPYLPLPNNYLQKKKISCFFSVKVSFYPQKAGAGDHRFKVCKRIQTETSYDAKISTTGTTESPLSWFFPGLFFGIQKGLIQVTLHQNQTVQTNKSKLFYIPPPPNRNFSAFWFLKSISWVFWKNSFINTLQDMKTNS